MRVTAAILPPLLLAGGPGCAASSWSRRAETPTGLQTAGRGRPGWSRLQAVAPGAEVEVRLYGEAEAIEGRFESVSAETLTLLLPDRSVRVLEGGAVHRVRVRRPLAERHWGWIAFGATAAAVSLLTSGSTLDLTNKAQLTVGLLAAAPVSVAAFRAQRMQLLYEAAPAASQLVTRIAVSVSDGDPIPRGEELAVSVHHAAGVGRPAGEPIGVTVCLSSRRRRCAGRRQRPVRRAGAGFAEPLHGPPRDRRAVSVGRLRAALRARGRDGGTELAAIRRAAGSRAGGRRGPGRGDGGPVRQGGRTFVTTRVVRYGPPGAVTADVHAAAADLLSASPSSGSRRRSATSASAACPYAATYCA